MARALLLAEMQGPQAAEDAYLEWRTAHAGLPLQRFYFVPFFVYTILGKPVEACRKTREFVSEIGPPRQVSAFDTAHFEYVTGRLSEEELLAAAIEQEDRNQAQFAIALMRLAEGDRNACLERLFLDHRSRRIPWGPAWGSIFLSRLEADPTWPPWIPLRDADVDGSATAPVQGSSGEDNG
jgi:hypothetical protein